MTMSVGKEQKAQKRELQFLWSKERSDEIDLRPIPTTRYRFHSVKD